MVVPTSSHPTAVEGEQRVLLSNVSWQTYDRLLLELDNRAVRLTYDRGALEIMSPSKRHERLKRLIGRMVEELTLELDIPISSCGSTTWRREIEARGLEPDECYVRFLGAALSIRPQATVASRKEVQDAAEERRRPWHH